MKGGSGVLNLKLMRLLFVHIFDDAVHDAVVWVSDWNDDDRYGTCFISERPLHSALDDDQSNLLSRSIIMLMLTLL